MRIAITNPFCWPEVRRGSERFLQELSAYMSEQGHEVTTISSHSGAYAEFSDEIGNHVRFSQPRVPGRLQRYLGPSHFFGHNLEKHLLGNSYDVVNCLSYLDTFGAARARAKGARHRIVSHFVGIPIRRYFRWIPHDGMACMYGLKHSDAIAVVSSFAQSQMRTEFGYESTVTYPPVNRDAFTPKTIPVEGHPRLLFVGDLNEIRKGATVLADAFVQLKKTTRTDATLTYSGHVTDERKASILHRIPKDLRGDVTFLGRGHVNDLPDLYKSATVTILPAIWEALGMSLIESLACGTPVVGCNHGGIPDIINSPDVGRIYQTYSLRKEPDNPEALAEAIDSCIELAGDPETIQRCWKSAQRFTWDHIGPIIESLYTNTHLPENLVAGAYE